MITKVLSFNVKEVAPRVLEFVGSTEDADRVGDVIMASGWKLQNYKKNPVFLWAHQYDSPPVGKANRVWVEDNRLKFQIQFADRDEYEFADTIYKLYKGGYLRATSVGFQPLESEPIEKEDSLYMNPTRYKKQDLLELSGCPVPANPNALAEAKTKGLVSLEELTILQEGETETWEEKQPLDTPIYVTDNVIPFEEARPGIPKEPKVITQAIIADEIDYLLNAITVEGMNEDNDKLAWVLVRTIMRQSGSDIPVDIQEAFKARLHEANHDRLVQIGILAQEVLDTAERVPERGLSAEDVTSIIESAVTGTIRKARGG